MSGRPRLLDAYSCEGGAARGYMDAGFDVTAIDIEARFAKRNPAREFVVADAIEFIKEHGHKFDAIHASPPCQRYTHGNAGSAAADNHPDLIGPTRDALETTGRPWVLENVPRAPLRNPLLLCGSMFDLSAVDDDGTPLRMERHRLFESSEFLYAPGPCAHDRRVRVAGSYGGARRDKDEARLIRKGGYVPSKAVQEQLLGIDWMTQHGLHQSLPPVYTRSLGEQLLDQITRRGAA